MGGHSTYVSALVSFFFYAGLTPFSTWALDARLRTLRGSMLAPSTKKTYGSYLRTYISFCNYLGIPIVPISTLNLCRFVAYLSLRLSFMSIRNYISVVRLLHLETGHNNPIDSYLVESTLKGAKRLLGASTCPKLPITPLLLQKMRQTLDFHNPPDLVFWGVCLVAFFSFFRKSNLLAPSWGLFDPKKHLSRSNISFDSSGAVISVTWSKTIQFSERTLLVPLPHIPDSPFCPSCILKLIFRLYPAPTHHFPTFTYRVNSHWCIVTYNWFLQKLKHVLSLIGVDPSKYSGHSFRRGGASFALECGLSPDLIKSQGDWKSGAYQSYLDPSLSCRSKVANRLGEEFRRLFPVSL